MKRLIGVLLYFISFSASAYTWDVDFYQVLDNTEFNSKNKYAEDATIFGAKFRINLGLNIKKHHSVYMGAAMFDEYGEDVDWEKLNLNLFYHYEKNGWSAYLGNFEKYGLIDYPTLLVSDSSMYFEHTMSGAFLEKKFKSGYQNIWIDWMSKQGDNKREIFAAGFSGKSKFSWFYLENYMYMYHFALPRLNKDKYHIRDNGAATFYAGIDFSEKIWFDEFKIDAGFVFEYDRDRANGQNFQALSGFHSRLDLRKNEYGLKASYYLGDELTLPLGDKLYGSGNYFRADLYYLIFTEEYISSVISFNSHITNGMFEVSQQLFLYIKLDNYADDAMNKIKDINF